MKKRLIFCAILVFLPILSASADTSIKAEVDRTSLSTDEALTYKVTVAVADKKTPSPNLPDFKGFYVLSQSESSNMSFAKNEIKFVLIYEFILAPEAAGDLKIAPSSIKTKDGEFSSDEFSIKVTQGKARPQKPSLEKPGSPKQDTPEPEEPQITL